MKTHFGRENCPELPGELEFVLPKLRKIFILNLSSNCFLMLANSFCCENKRLHKSSISQSTFEVPIKTRMLIVY